MAVTRGATTSECKTTVTVTSCDIAHTVDVGTTLLIVTVNTRADETVTSIIWSLGGGETLTLIDAAVGANSGDQACFMYGFVNPTAGAGTVAVTHSETNRLHTCAINYIGTVSSSVAAATNFVSEDINNANTNTTVCTSGGSAGNALIFSGNIRGADGTPTSNATSFNELFEGETGGGSATADIAYYVADLLDSAPETITATWNTTDHNVGHLIEIVAASVGGRIMASLADAGGLAGPGGIAGQGGGLAGQKMTTHEIRLAL